MQPLAVLTRTEKIESIHHGYICVSNSENQVVYHLGNPRSRTYMRSVAKPFQALPLVKSGAVEEFGITPGELAVICSSHSGEDFHRAAVLSVLQKAGLKEEYLACGAANPYNKEMADMLKRSGQRPSPLFNCCSGNHAGMLALCRFMGFPVEGYTELNHPVQKTIMQTLSELLGCAPSDIETGIDGCGVPSFLLEVRQISFLYSLLAQGERAESGFGKSLALISEAMLNYPHMVNGDKEFCTELVIHSGRRIIGKIGGEGVYCVSVPERDLGICVKILDGNERGVYPVTVNILKQLGIIGREEMASLMHWACPPVKNHKGVLVGHTLPVFDITAGKSEKVQTGQHYVQGDIPWSH